MERNNGTRSGSYNCSQFSRTVFCSSKKCQEENFPIAIWTGAGGKIDPREKPKKAARRELGEELGIRPLIRFLFTTNFESPELTHALHVFECFWNGEITPCGEFEWSGWLRKEDVNQLIVERKLCPDTKVICEQYMETP